MCEAKRSNIWRITSYLLFRELGESLVHFGPPTLDTTQIHSASKGSIHSEESIVCRLTWTEKGFLEDWTLYNPVVVRVQSYVDFTDEPRGCCVRTTLVSGPTGPQAATTSAVPQAAPAAQAGGRLQNRQ